MDTPKYAIKTTGYFHFAHGLIMSISSLISVFGTVKYYGILAGLLILAIYGGITFLYIYIGYQLFSLKTPDKVRNALITAIILACLQIGSAILQRMNLGFWYIPELILSVVSIYLFKYYKKDYGKKKRN